MRSQYYIALGRVLGEEGSLDGIIFNLDKQFRVTKENYFSVSVLGMFPVSVWNL